MYIHTYVCMYIRTLCAYVPSRYFFVIFIVVVIYLFIYYSNVLGRIGVDEQTDCTPVPCRYSFFYVLFLFYFVLLFIYFRVDRSWRAERWYIGALLLFPAALLPVDSKVPVDGVTDGPP